MENGKISRNTYEVLDIPGHVIHRNDRKDGRRCGGVAVLTRQDVPCERLTSLESTDVETLWLLYRRPRMPRCLSHVVVGTVYNPPSSDDKKMTIWTAWTRLHETTHRPVSLCLVISTACGTQQSLATHSDRS